MENAGRAFCGGGRPRDDGRVATVLVVEDERDIRDVLRRYLERAGHSVLTAAAGAAGSTAIADAEPDLVVLDLGLPDIDGTELLRQAHDASIPVIVLTARSAVDDRIHGLELGADDYVTKPFSPRELVLRVAAVLHRISTASGVATQELSFGSGRLRIDVAMHQVYSHDALIATTPTEWALLTALATTPGRVFSRAELVNRARGFEFAGYERTIDSHVKNLRHKLGTDGADVIQTVTGAGYRLGLVRDD